LIHDLDNGVIREAIQEESRSRRNGGGAKGEAKSAAARRKLNSPAMALLMEPGAEPLTESEQADLAGIAAIKEAAAREYKEQGNQFVRMGRKHYAEAVSCYTKAIAQMEPLSALDTGAAADASVLFANRAHVNLLLGNHRRALDDAEQAIRLSPSSVKVTVPFLLSDVMDPVVELAA